MSDEQPSVNPYMDDSDPYDYDYQPFQRQAEETTTQQQTEQEVPEQQEKKLPPPPIEHFQKSQDEDDSEINEGGDDIMNENELKRKAMELARREAELERRERELQRKGGDQQPYKKPNFPICYPFVYHNIRDEIPSGLRRRVAYLGFLGWIVLIILVSLNFVCACTTVAVPVASPGGGIADPIQKAKFIVVSFLWILIGIPGHFALCYWPLYTAMRSCHVGRFFIFFIGYAIAVLMAGFAVSGYFEYGPCGIIAAIAYFPSTGSALAFIINLAMAGLWGLQCAYYVLIYAMAIAVFRKRHSLAKVAKQVKDEVVQQAAKTVVQTAINSINQPDDAV